MKTQDAKAITTFRRYATHQRGACIRLMRRHGCRRYGAAIWRAVTA